MDAGKNRGKGFDKPNYTQTPNVLFDSLMRDMREAELKVTLAIVRETFGYHREKHKLSLTELQRYTGMSRQGVINGVEAGIERGTIGRDGDQKVGFEYSLAFQKEQPESSASSELVNEVDQQASQRNGLAVVNDVDQGSQPSRPEVVNQVDQFTPTLKKEKETIKEKVKERKKSSSAHIEQNLTEKPDDDDDFFNAIHQAWRDAMPSKLTDYIKRRLGELAAEHGAVKVIRAILDSADAGGRSLKYVETTLKNMADGVTAQSAAVGGSPYTPADMKDIVLGYVDPDQLIANGDPTP